MARIGFTACGCCGNPEASISKTATGTLSLTCHRCEFSGFAKVGTKAHRLTTAAMTIDDDETGAPAPVIDPTPAKAPKAPKAPTPTTPPRAARSVFELADL